MNDQIDKMFSEYCKLTEALSQDELLLFYEVFSLGLTGAIRLAIGIRSFEECDRLRRIDLINEILHGSTAKVSVLRLKTHEWTEKSFWQMVAEYVSADQAIAPLVEDAVQIALKAAKSGLRKLSDLV